MNTARAIRGKSEQRFDGGAGTPAGPKLHDLTQQDQRDDHRACLEVDTDLSTISSKCDRENTREQRCNQAVEVGDSSAKRNQGKHVQIKTDHRAPAPHEKWRTTPEHHR